MTYYTRWADVPETLKTKTAIRQAGKRRRPKQPVIAQIDTTWGTHGGVKEYVMRRIFYEINPEKYL